MKSADKSYYREPTAEDQPAREKKPEKHDKSIEETRREQREKADPKEQSPTRKGYG
jgi:hypothetical protein